MKDLGIEFPDTPNLPCEAIEDLGEKALTKDPWNLLFSVEFSSLLDKNFVNNLKTKMGECHKEYLKKTRATIEKWWEVAVKHSTNLRDGLKENKNLHAQVSQQQVGLAVGVPGGAAVGAGIYPLFKCCMKFFSK